MKFQQAKAEIFVPDQCPLPEAISRITHLGVGAHHDDLEFMAFHGIAQCFEKNDRWFGGVTCTNGAGSSRAGAFSEYSDEQMMQVRRQEQNTAATIGKYGVMIQLDHPSSEVKGVGAKSLKADLRQILSVATPEVVYTHNPADKHDTHIGVLRATLEVLRELPLERRPQRLIGCEVWRDLDWMPDEAKVVMDVSGHDQLGVALNSVFQSQIGGGKRYDLAILGRRSANATFLQSHSGDNATQVIFGMDLTPLIHDAKLDIVKYVCGFVDEFKRDVERRLSGNSKP